MLFNNNRKLLDSLLWGSAGGYPIDSLASCLSLPPAWLILQGSQMTEFFWK